MRLKHRIHLTSSTILFFNHPIRIWDRIRIIDKDYDYTGIIKDINGFFLFMQTDEIKNMTIPTSISMQIGIEIIEEKEPSRDKEDFNYEYTEGDS